MLTNRKSRSAKKAGASCGAEKKFECPICLEPIHDPVRTKKCGHVFCFECVVGQLDLHSCPLCRHEFVSKRSLLSSLNGTMDMTPSIPLSHDFEVCQQTVLLMAIHYHPRDLEAMTVKRQQTLEKRLAALTVRRFGKEPESACADVLNLAAADSLTPHEIAFGLGAEQYLCSNNGDGDENAGMAIFQLVWRDLLGKKSHLRKVEVNGGQQQSPQQSLRAVFGGSSQQCRGLFYIKVDARDAEDGDDGRGSRQQDQQRMVSVNGMMRRCAPSLLAPSQRAEEDRRQERTREGGDEGGSSAVQLPALSSASPRERHNNRHHHLRGILGSTKPATCVGWLSNHDNDENTQTLQLSPKHKRKSAPSLLQSHKTRLFSNNKRKDLGGRGGGSDEDDDDFFRLSREAAKHRSRASVQASMENLPTVSTSASAGGGGAKKFRKNTRSTVATSLDRLQQPTGRHRGAMTAALTSLKNNTGGMKF